MSSVGQKECLAVSEVVTLWASSVGLTCYGLIIGSAVSLLTTKEQQFTGLPTESRCQSGRGTT